MERTLYVFFRKKQCKGLRGLQAHKRACKVITADTESLFDSPTLTGNVLVEDVSFDEIIFKKYQH